jgi:hypothetical protein
MATLPIPQNVTVDIYRNSDPTSPVPAGTAASSAVPGYIKPVMTSGRFGSALYLKWTHLLILPSGTDIRDAYNSQLDPSRSKWWHARRYSAGRGITSFSLSKPTEAA